MLCSGTVPPGAAPVWREGEGLVTEGAVCVGKLWLINTERECCGARAGAWRKWGNWANAGVLWPQCLLQGHGQVSRTRTWSSKPPLIRQEHFTTHQW